MLDQATDPAPGSRWQHRNGNVYTVLYITNKPDELRYPKTVVYQGDNGEVWSRRADDWARSMTALPAAEPKPPASEALVLQHMMDAYEAAPNEALAEAEAMLTAARALGVLMPEEAAGLREERDKAWKTERAATNAADEYEAERDALADRLARAEEALREAIAIIAMVEAHTPAKYLPGAYPMYGLEKLRADLTPPPEAKDAEA